MTVEAEDDDHIPTALPNATSGPGGAAKVGAKKKSPPPCPKCKKGFQLKRVPPTHVKCSICENWSQFYHPSTWYPKSFSLDQSTGIFDSWVSMLFWTPKWGLRFPKTTFLNWPLSWACRSETLRFRVYPTSNSARNSWRWWLWNPQYTRSCFEIFYVLTILIIVQGVP